MNNLFLLLILSHLISDFLMQNKRIIRLKEEFKYPGYIVHMLITFAVSFLFIFNYGLPFALRVSSILSIVHIILDILKGVVCKWFNQNPKFKLLMFFTDQALHVLSILIIWSRFINYSGSSRTVFNIEVNEQIISMLNWFPIDSNKFLLLLIFYIAIMFAGAILLELILNLVNDGQYRESNNRVSCYIGIVERGLILTLVAFGPISSLGMILTAKSLARFNKLSEREFAEYYLMGTLTSMSIALVGGLVLKYLLGL